MARKEPDFAERLQTAAKAKQALLEKTRAAAVANGVQNEVALYTAPLVSVGKPDTPWKRICDFTDKVTERLKNFVTKAAQATLVGDVFDDAATGQGLLNYFLRALGCGAISEQEAIDMSGLTLDELRSRSFVGILRNRTSSSA